MGLSLVVSGDPLAAELAVLGGGSAGVQPPKPFCTSEPTLPEWLQGAGWVHRFVKDATHIHITGTFSGYGYYVEAIRHQFREKKTYSLWEALLIYLRQQHTLSYAWEG